jgi:3-carboxy-cis,cis-muconate cycloisomerase
MSDTNKKSSAPAAHPHRVRQLFSRRAQIQSWLDVEAALAQAQAELGMIPGDAAAEITRRARLECLDEPALQADMARTRAPIASLVRFLAAACDGGAGTYVHWGATTQNIMQTASVRQIQRAHRALLNRFAGCLERLTELAELGAGMVMAGRTQRRHALPITFGFKAAGWIEELLRHEERLRNAEPRVFTAVFGGAVGAMHAFGEHGPELNRRVAQRLGLSHFVVPSRAANDHLVEYVMLLALLGSSCSKFAQELYTLMADEFGEVAEDLGSEVIGSSTMPQKVNSKVAVDVIALAAQLRAQVGLALEATQVRHEADAAHNKMLYAALENACSLAFDTLTAMHELLTNLRLLPERMRRNLDHSAGFINAEHVMMRLAANGLDRQTAHDVLHDACMAAAAERSPLAPLLADRVAGYMSAAEIDAALDPEAYTGHCVELSRQVAGLARERLARMGPLAD